MIVAPNLSDPSCCTSSNFRHGTGGRWFQAFVTDYEQAHGGAKPPIDVLSVHLYGTDNTTGTTSPADESNFVSDLQKFRHEADGLGYAETPIWVTEMSFENIGQPITSGQTAHIKQILGELVAAAPSLDLQRVFYFTDNDPRVTSQGLKPLYDPSATSSPSSAMPLTDLGQVVAGIATPAG